MSFQLQEKLARSLLALRLGIFIVMFVWALDKFVNPEHTAIIFENFYGVGGLSANIAMLLGVLQVALCVAFVVGLWKTITYGLIFLLHGATTLSSLPQYFDAFNNLLFFAAWPMWAACFVLFYLRDYDRYSLGGAQLDAQR